MRTAFMRVILFCLCFAGLAGFPAAKAFEINYLPLDSRALSRRVAQKLRADPLEAGKPISVGKTTIEIPPGGSPFAPETTTLQVHGTDDQGKAWSYVSSAWTGSASVWTADLDKNGREDLIILMHTGACGAGPSCSLLVLMFEKSGRPVPFVVDGYFEVDSHGIKYFVDLENDGHAQLIRQSFDDGYWITSFYQAAACRFHRLKAISGMTLPLYTRFSTEPNHKCIKPPSFRHPFEADLSNDCANPLKCSPQKFLDEINWAKVDNSEDPCLLLSDGKRSRPFAWYGTMTVVLDEPAGRRMASLSTGEAVHRLLSEISYRRLPVSLSGARRNASRGLSSEFIFAQSQSNAAAKPGFFRQTKSLDLALSDYHNPELP